MCLEGAEEPTTEAGRNYVKATRIIIVCQIVITITNFVAADYFLREAIFGIMFVVLLYAAQHHLSYQVIMIYIFISIFFAVRYLLFFLQPVQNEQPFSDYTNIQQFAIYEAMVSFVYYTFCSIFFYFPYKEFKVQAYNQNPALKHYFEHERELKETA
jgi:hypothetical protein